MCLRAQMMRNRQAIAFARDVVKDDDIAADFFDEVSKVNGAVSAYAVARSHTDVANLTPFNEPHGHLDARAIGRSSSTPPRH